jgi:hypothetical protein
LVSIAWKALSEEEREKWEEMGRKDKARYEMEKAMYSGPWKVPMTGKKEKDPSKPKRPMSAFLSFSNRKRSMVKEQHKFAKTADVSRILAQMWKEAPAEEKQEFIDEEFALRQEYKSTMAEWKEKTDKKISKAREERENEAMKLVLEGKLPPDPFPLTSATTLPNGAEYNTGMGEDKGYYQQQQTEAAGNPGYPATAAAYHLEGSATAAAFQPPLDPSRRNDYPYRPLYGAYQHHYPYSSSVYAGKLTTAKELRFC